MSRIRILLTWLILAALPLQGFAAASMLICGADAGSQVHQGRLASVAAVPPAHDHAGHSHTNAHAGKLAKVAQGGTHAHDAGHTCGACAACCNTVAIMGMARLAPLAPMPQSRAAEPFVLIHARAASVPDKPPRA